MGQKQPQNKVDQLPSPQFITKSIDALFNSNSPIFTLDNTSSPIICISRMISQLGLSTQTQEGFKSNTIYLRCVYHQYFEQTIRKLIQLFIDDIQQISKAKLIMMVPRQRFRKCLNLINFCLFFVDQTHLQNTGLLNVRTDLHPETQAIVRKMAQQGREISLPLQGFDSQHRGEIARMLRISMVMMLDLHMKLLSRSDFTLAIIDRLNQSSFMLYCRLFFQSSQMMRRQRGQHSKSIMKLAAYFIGVGIDKKHPAVYQSAVLLMLNLAQNESISQGQALPSHLFKKLPIISNNQIIYWTCCILIYSLQHVSHQGRVFCRLNANRIPAFQLLQKLFSSFKPKGPQIVFLLEELCMQTRPTQIQRVYVSSIAAIHAQYQDGSQIIKRYADSKSVNFNIRTLKKQIKVKPQDIMTQLQGDQDSTRKEIGSLCNKFTQHAILHSGLMFNYSDKSLWGQILHNLQSEGSFQEQQEHRQSNQAGLVEENMDMRDDNYLSKKASSQEQYEKFSHQVSRKGKKEIVQRNKAEDEEQEQIIDEDQEKPKQIEKEEKKRQTIEFQEQSFAQYTTSPDKPKQQEKTQQKKVQQVEKDVYEQQKQQKVEPKPQRQPVEQEKEQEKVADSEAKVIQSEPTNVQSQNVLISQNDGGHQ